MPFCTQCGSDVPSGTFCPKCGAALGAAAAGGAASPVGGGAASASSGEVQENLMGALSYLVITAIIFLVIEPYKNNKFVRFHSFQALFYWAACFVLMIGISVLSFVFAMMGSLVSLMGMVVYPVAWLAMVIGWFLLVFKAYQGQKFKLPVIGDLAEKQA